MDNIFNNPEKRKRTKQEVTNHFKTAEESYGEKIRKGLINFLGAEDPYKEALARTSSRKSPSSPKGQQE